MIKAVGSIRTGMKESNIVPIYKKGDRKLWKL
jgi:hypothetical protein